MIVAYRNITMMAAILLVSILTLGYAQNTEAMPDMAQLEAAKQAGKGAVVVRVKKEESMGCRSCHGADAAGGAGDFSAIYDSPESHHPVGVVYPVNGEKPNFVLPNGKTRVISFFDRNGNGKPDNDEVRMFGPANEPTVECASCHMEHAGAHTMGNAHTKLYLRDENKSSTLCTTCHQY